MAQKTIQTFSIDYLSILDSEARIDPALEPKLKPEQLRWAFEQMLTVREFDQRGIHLQRQGRIGTFSPCTGQEAVSIGSALALSPKDWAVPSFREQGVYLARGVKASTLFLFFMGTEEGNRIPRQLHTLPYCIPCATQAVQAVGIAMAAKIKKDSAAVLTYFGDGATSEGDLHEAMNFAGVYSAPVVFICQNNQWAISTPREMQNKAQTLAQKAIGYGIKGLQVDGNDLLAVYSATANALAEIRQGKGPSFLECLTYRMGVHTTSDDPSRYRQAEEAEAWVKKDPIDRFEKYLLAKAVIQTGDRERLSAEIAGKLKKEAELAEEICQQLSPDEMFNYMYAELPEFLKPQRLDALQQSGPKKATGRAHG